MGPSQKLSFAYEFIRYAGILAPELSDLMVRRTGTGSGRITIGYGIGCDQYPDEDHNYTYAYNTNKLSNLEQQIDSSS